MNKSVMLDTSFLICLVDKGRTNHHNAKGYLEYFLKEKYILYISTIAISEFTIVDSVTTIPLNLFRILPFNFNHSINIENLFYNYLKGTEGVSRDSIKDDLKIITQAERERILYS